MKNNYKSRQFSRRIQVFPKRGAGQALILVMAIVLIASVVVFLVFNSGRAVNEKINLVNAADAAAYSGAQIAARQLNFMAYTNRAMIANEMAIGHMFSLQMEVRVASQSLTFVADFFSALLGWIPWLGPRIDAVLQFLLVDSVEVMADSNELITGAYASMVDANNAFYSSLQFEAYKDLAYPLEGRTLIEAAMGSVVREYQMRSTAPIIMNLDQTLDAFKDSENQSVADAARAADDMGAGFCEMVLFAQPSAAGEDPAESNGVNDFCSDLLASEGDEEGTQTGSPNNPVADNGAMLDMLRTMVSEFGNAEWIRDRNHEYRILGFNIRRRGATTVDVTGPDGGLNWQSANDSLRVGDPLLNLPLGTVSTSGNVAQFSADTADQINQNLDELVDWMANVGICKRAEENEENGELSCEDALMGRYEGIRRYAYLNPVQTTPVITAFLTQTSCGDTVGVDEEGRRVQGWHDGPRFLDEHRSFCNDAEHDRVYAVSQAEVYFERPPCDDNNCAFGFRDLPAVDGRPVVEQPNLYNPFWQARLRPL